MPAGEPEPLLGLRGAVTTLRPRQGLHTNPCISSLCPRGYSRLAPGSAARAAGFLPYCGESPGWHRAAATAPIFGPSAAGQATRGGLEGALEAAEDRTQGRMKSGSLFRSHFQVAEYYT